MDQTKYCDFHECYGHTTENCIQLWDAIESLIQDGRLKTMSKWAGARGAVVLEEAQDGTTVSLLEEILGVITGATVTLHPGVEIIKRIKEQTDNLVILRR